MASDNQITIVGNLTDDPELRYTSNGAAVANFRVAYSTRIRDAAGNWTDGETSFFLPIGYHSGFVIVMSAGFSSYRMRWIGQLLNALQQASKRTEELSTAYSLELDGNQSIVSESQKIPASKTRETFLIDCWLESLCTAEIRVLGWLYREFYGRPFHPNNF